jgi:glucose/arabinose dehydrogenase
MVKRLLLALPLAVCLAGCFTLAPSTGGGQDVDFQGARRLNAADVALPPGYAISVVASNLNFPTGVCFDDHGGVYVTEAGAADRQPHLLRINPDGSTLTIASGTKPPWNGVSFYHGDFYVSESGAILKISADGAVTPAAENLPSLGDYQTSGPIIGDDGYIYFGQGAATNSGVVGPDNIAWLATNRRFHDVPGTDVTLAGLNVQSADPFSPTTDTGAPVSVTGAFSPFGEPTAAGQSVEGQVPCSGGVMRIPLAGGPPELVAWGFRNPFGLAFAPSGRLFVTDQSYEDRGSRPVSGCGDLLWAVDSKNWYGWPDYWGDRPLDSSRQFAAVAKPPPAPLMAKYPNVPPKPWAIFGMHAGAAGMDFCRNAAFGHAGEAFVAEFGDLAPISGKLEAPVGFDVLRVDPVAGVSHVFAANKSDATGPASKVGGAGLERPIAVRFDPAGDALYVVDYGVVTVDEQAHPRAGTGVLWKITRLAGH